MKNDKIELVSFSEMLMLSPFFDQRILYQPEIENIKNGFESLIQSGLLIREEDQSELIEYHDKVAVLTIEGPLRPGGGFFFSTGYDDIFVREKQ